MHFECAWHMLWLWVGAGNCTLGSAKEPQPFLLSLTSVWMHDSKQKQRRPYCLRITYSLRAQMKVVLRPGRVPRKWNMACIIPIHANKKNCINRYCKPCRWTNTQPSFKTHHCGGGKVRWCAWLLLAWSASVARHSCRTLKRLSLRDRFWTLRRTSLWDRGSTLQTRERWVMRWERKDARTKEGVSHTIFFWRCHHQ